MHSAFIVMLILMLAANAHAGCAWVLWESNVLTRRTLDQQQYKADAKRFWEAKSAFLQSAECRKEMEKTITQITAQAKGEVSRSSTSGEVLIVAGRPPEEGVIVLDVYRFKCLPDTVKPEL